MHYPFVPFQPVAKRFFDKDFYDVQVWVKENTDKNALLLVIESQDNFKKEIGDCNGGFRNGSARSVWCQDIVSAYGDAESFREWKRRRQLLQEYLQYPFEAWRPLIKAEGIDYVVSLKGSHWPKGYKLVYDSAKWVVYKVASK